MTHVDDYIEDLDGHPYAQWVFLHFRLPAWLRIRFSEFMKNRRLFCSWQGTRYRVTGASRFGDVWLTENFEKDCGYDHRVDLAECSDWGAEP